MKSTSILTVSTDLYLHDDIVIHPNEGFDMGIISPSTPVKIYCNITVEEFCSCTGENFCGNLQLNNQCRNGVMLIGKKLWKKIGMPAEVKLYYDKDKILIANK